MSIIFTFILLFLGMFLTAGNLLDNGDFEKLFASWDYPSWEKRPQPGQVTDDCVFSGRFSYRLGNPQSNGTNYIYTHLPYEPGNTYVLKMAVKALNLPKEGFYARILCSTKDENGKSRILPFASIGDHINKLITAEGTFDWKELSATLHPHSFPPETRSLTLLVYQDPNNQGTAWVDAISWTTGDDDMENANPVTLTNAPQLPQQSQGRNLWPGDNSFETSSQILNLPRTTAQAHHGKYSLEMPASMKRIGTANLFNLLAANQAHDFSFWAKADSQGEIIFESWDQNYRRTHYEKQFVGTEWKRFVINYPASTVAVSPTITFNKPMGMTLWLDDFQIMPAGETSDSYIASAPFTLGVERIGLPVEYVEPSQQSLRRRLAIRNNTPQPQTITLNTVVQRALDTPRELFSKEITLASGQLLEKECTLLEHCDVCGYYTVTLSAKTMEYFNASQMPFVIMPQPLPATDDSFAGIHSGNKESIRRANVSWLRTFHWWKFTSEKDGLYQFGDLTSPRRDFSIRCLETINVAEPMSKYRKGDWADMDEITRFLLAFTAACPHTDVIEIENEPDLVFPSALRKNSVEAATAYADMLNHVVPKMREIKPSLKLAASGVSGVDFTHDFVFTDTVLAKAGKNIDIVAVHPYSDARYLGPDNSDIGPEINGVWRRTEQLKNIIAKHGGKQEIWFGEIGWALDVREAFQSEAALRHGDYCARLLLLAKALDVRHVTYFLADAHIERQFYYYGLWRQGQPLPAAAAFTATSHMLEGASCVKVIMNSDIHAFVFKHRQGRHFAVLWTSGALPVKATINLPQDKLECRDMYNGLVPLSPDGPLQVTLTGHPQYIFADNSLDARDFCQKIKEMKLDSPPVSASWQFTKANHLKIRLENLRAIPVSCRITLTTGNQPPEMRSLGILPPGKGKVVDFETAGTYNHCPLHLEAETDQGRLVSNYLLDILPCPGTFPNLDNRDYLLPNDPGNGWAGPQDLSVSGDMSYDQENLYLHLKVHDDIHFQKYRPGSLWQGDSLQVAIDAKANALPNMLGYSQDDLELGFALTPEGPAKEVTFIYEVGRTQSVLNAIKADITRDGNITDYKLALPWSILHITPERGTVFGLNFIAVDNDGNGRRFWMGLTPGIAEAKNPYAFKRFVLE